MNTMPRNLMAISQSTGKKRADAPSGNISSDVGISRKDVHEARKIRDAERDNLGVIKDSVKAVLERGDELTKAAIRRRIVDAAADGLRGIRASRKNPDKIDDPESDRVSKLGELRARQVSHQAAAPVGGTRRALLNRFWDTLLTRIPPQWRHARRAGLVTLQN
ncbi:hypothetical protein GI582_10930 [Sulfitobacter sp. BDSS02]|nr:hypothetical protein [Sulfitobacter sp. BDSS02]MBR9850000.1 hypothetical protein [Paracoccaceae bacterium]